MTNLDDQHQLADQILSDQSSALDLHNTARESQGLPPLQWDAGLSDVATRWAQHLAREGKFYHQKGSGTGENLVWISACFTPYQAAAQCWLDEVENYHDQRIGEGDFLSYGHYTQCMWYSTTKVGMGAARDSDGNIYVVARYFPPGNFSGERPY